LSGRRRSWGVPLASAGLVVAVWLSLQLAPTPASVDGEREGREARVELPASLPGFRADLFFLPDDSLLGFVEIPSGSFVMGSDPATDPLAYDIERWSEDAPQGMVELPAYFIGRYEVTVAQYAAFVRESGHRVSDEAALRGGLEDPVANVAWTDALAYARWLTGALARTSATPSGVARLLARGWTVRLPTEAQWEKAARGTDARVYPWGNEPRRDRANFAARGVVPVGTVACPECAHGLSDMAGNVWEWTSSPYLPYPFDPALSRVDLAAEALFVMRGGSYQDSERNVRAAVRGGADPGARRPFIGFRVVLARS
jgi:formylglycine-generating enzyme required for sulfatase activity